MVFLNNDTSYYYYIYYETCVYVYIYSIHAYLPYFIKKSENTRACSNGFNDNYTVRICCCGWRTRRKITVNSY